MIYDIENSIGFLLAKAHQRGWALFAEAISSFEITPTQFSLLAFLWQDDEQTQAELSEKTQIDRTTICGLVDRLERSGMVERKAHPQDRRAYLICLTDKGRSLEPELAAAAHDTLDRFLEGLSADDRQELIRMLRILRGEEKSNVYAHPIA